MRPPSQRNFQVHYFLQEGGTTREAAARFGISQTRVRQVERQVVGWAAQVLPVESEAEAAGLARVAQSVAADRLEHFYQQTMREWNATHQPKFLNLALRVTMATVRLPGRAYEIGAAEADLLEPEGEEASPRSKVQGPKLTEGKPVSVAPPVGACSEQEADSEESSVLPQRENDANASGGRLSELLRTAPQQALAALSPPARSLLSGGDGNVITQLRLTPDEPGASIERSHSSGGLRSDSSGGLRSHSSGGLRVLSQPQRELTRQERRRLQKKLKRAKGLA